MKAFDGFFFFELRTLRGECGRCCSLFFSPHERPTRVSRAEMRAIVFETIYASVKRLFLSASLIRLDALR